MASTTASEDRVQKSSLIIFALAISFLETYSALKVAGGRTHTCALEDSGAIHNIKCWGSNTYGNLGLGDTSPRNDPSILPVLELGTGFNPVSISLGREHSCALSDSATIKCWGHAQWGQCGDGSSGFGTYIGDIAGEMGDNLPIVNLGTGFIPIDIVVGEYHSCALSDNGDVKCWGENRGGQLGQGDTTDRGNSDSDMGDFLPAINLGTNFNAISIACGSQYSCALSDNGDIKCWGDNQYGYLGYGDTTDRGISGTEMGDNLPTINLGTGFNAVSIAASGVSTCALSDSGIMKCWGWNLNGELGIGDKENRGDNPGEMGNNLTVTDLGSAFNIQSIIGGHQSMCAVSNSGTIKCWGYNGNAQLGLGDWNTRGDLLSEMGDNLPIVNLGTGFDVSSAGLGWFHSCAISDTGDLKCWGTNSDGQLGLGDTTLRGSQPSHMGDNLPIVNLAFPTSAPTLTTTSPSNSPTSSTSSPTLTTSVPTMSPTSTTSTPTATTTSPTTTTSSPTTSTSSPTNVPTSTTSSPTSTTTLPTSTPTTTTSNPTNSPTSSTSTPTASTSSPTLSTISPTETTSSPSNSPTISTSSPTSTTNSPTITTNSPTSTTISPTATTNIPTKTTSSPTATTISPTATTSSPTGTTSSPSNSPTISTYSPSASTSSPTSTSFPTSTTTSPTATSSSPTVNTVSPSSTTLSPTRITSFPTLYPSFHPTAEPTIEPTLYPTNEPIFQSTELFSETDIFIPSIGPTKEHTEIDAAQPQQNRFIGWIVSLIIMLMF